MGKPALRIGDLTAHGGTVTVGKPTVMIGKMPASTLGDMHVCPMTTGPVPHVGGPAVLGSMGVLLSKMPGARVSDMHVCVGPPSMGAMGCMTVLIGEAGSGGDAGNAAAAAAAASASKKGPGAIQPFQPAEPPGPVAEVHWVEVQLVDSAGFPLGGVRYKLKDPDGNDVIGASSTEGRIRHDGYANAGSFSIEFPGVDNAKWPAAKNKPNEALKLKADATAFKDGTAAMVVIFEERDAGRFQRMLDRVPGKVQGGKVEVEWKMLKEHYPLPIDPKKKKHSLEEEPEGKIEYFFFVEVEGLVGPSDRAVFLEDAEIAVVDKDNKPIGQKEYQLKLIDGTIRKGKLDKDGKATEKDIPVGPYQLLLPGVEKAPEEKKPDPGPGPEPTADLVFPLPFRPKDSYKRKGLSFNSNRKDEKAAERKKKGAEVPDWELVRGHAGCDLLAPVGTDILAMKDGKVIKGPYHFYNNGVQAIEVDHGDLIVRYCEISPLAVPITKEGDKVVKGQKIAEVGKMFKSSMLHLEMYSKTAKGPLTQKPHVIKETDPENIKRFRRRADLIDPTPFLDKAALKGEKPEEKPASEEDAGDEDEEDGETVASSGTPYQGKILQSGSTESQLIQELQNDLLKLGYWISSPVSETGKGMDADSQFGSSTENAVKTFQLEHFVVMADGNLDAGKKSKITGKVDTETGKKIKDELAALGQSKWRRPGHKAKKKWKKNGSTVEKDFGTFHQIVPSEGYYRRSPNYGSKESIHHSKLDVDVTSFEVLDGEDSPWAMADCWGTKQMVDFLKKVGDTWKSKKVGGKDVPAFMIGDVSAFNGGPLDPHRTHQDGTGADLNGTICSIQAFKEEWHREAALELAKLLQENGAKRLLFNCHYVIKNTTIASELIAHHHHFHVDGPGSDDARPSDPYTTCNSCGIYDICTKRINKVKKDASSPAVDYDRNAAKGSSGGLYASSDSRSKGVVRLSQVDS